MHDFLGGGLFLTGDPARGKYRSVLKNCYIRTAVGHALKDVVERVAKRLKRGTVIERNGLMIHIVPASSGQIAQDLSLLPSQAVTPLKSRVT